MLSYPIDITPNKAGVLSIKFPDFPGCGIPCPPSPDWKTDDLEKLSPLINRAQNLAAWYLVGNATRPGWIIKRLHDGYLIPKPGTYPSDPNALLHLDANLILPEQVDTALRFHWLASTLQRTTAETADLLGIKPEKLWMIEHARIRPNHKELARMRFLEKNSYQRIFKTTDTTSHKAAS